MLRLSASPLRFDDEEGRGQVGCAEAQDDVRLYRTPTVAGSPARPELGSRHAAIERLERWRVAVRIGCAAQPGEETVVGGLQVERADDR